ncbi:hypothetical protein [Sphaerobacter thermophilus]|uniref:phage adaptor protein n=1 Tax=Sphaerobacter thermophilus TaxID=2057 RepID=UPI0039C0368D
MPTLSQMRDRLRLWLEDDGTVGLWTDAELDEALRWSLERYSRWEPAERILTAAVDAGATEIALPEDTLDVARVVAPGGQVIPRRAAAPARVVAGEELAWEQFAGALRFTQPLVAGSYTVYYAATRTFPATGDEPFPVPPAAEALILTGALVWALEFRAREEWKRGPLPPRYESRLEAARRDYQALQRDLRRRLRTRTVEVSG